MAEYWRRVRRKLRSDADKLREVFEGKCAFCESTMRHVSSPQIEHYRPKSRKEFEDLAFVWENWLLSCGNCNGKKWAHFPICGTVPCLLDPTSDNPAVHIDFAGARPLALTERGHETIRLLGLDRAPLEDEREKWLTLIRALLLLAKPPSACREARELLIWSMQSDAPYSAMTRRYLHEQAPRLATPKVPHPRIEVTDAVQRICELVVRCCDELQALV
jgi:uncharacterized protein (TIGR02646 family)